MLVYPDSPTIAVVDGVLSEEECNHLIEVAEPLLVESETVTKTGTKKNEKRTSHGCYLGHEHTEVITDICKRLADISGLSLKQAEPANILRYTSEQEYKPHYDAFNEELHKQNGGQRILTMLAYLNNVAGGSTAFPNLNLMVGCIAGRILMFGNVDKDKNPHPLALHQGISPIEGEKWIFTLWFREDEVKKETK